MSVRIARRIEVLVLEFKPVELKSEYEIMREVSYTLSSIIAWHMPMSRPWRKLMRVWKYIIRSRSDEAKFESSKLAPRRNLHSVN